MKIIKMVWGLLLAMLLTACGGGGGSSGVNPNQANLLTNAPSSLTLPLGTERSYTLSGGLAPYTVASSNTDVVVVTQASGLFKLSAVKVGVAQVRLQDAQGQAITLTVTVPQDLASTLTIQAPDSVVLRIGLAQSYQITGGQGAYSVASSDVGVLRATVEANGMLNLVAVSSGNASVRVYDQGGNATVLSAQVIPVAELAVQAPASVRVATGVTQTYQILGGVPLYNATSSDTSVVRASVDFGNTLMLVGVAPGNAVVRVADSAGKVVQLSVSGGTVLPLSVVSPASLQMVVGTAQAYKITGGYPPYQTSVGNAAVLSASVQNSDTLQLNAIKSGTAEVVLVDTQGNSVTRSVAVSSESSVNNTALFTTSPTAITLKAGQTSTMFQINGGTSPYTVVSSNTNVATASHSGNTFSVQGIAEGTAQVLVTDGVGNAVTVAVTVPKADNTVVGEPAASVEVLASGNTLQSAGGELDITAYVKDRFNATLADRAVSFAASDGLIIQALSATTDSAGAVKAKLRVGTDKSNRAVTVTVRSGTASGFVSLDVVGTKVSVSGEGTVKLGASATYAVRVVDSSGNGIANVPVSLTSSLGNTLTPATTNTNSLGLANVNYTATKAGTDTLTASYLGTTGAQTVSISAVDLSFVSPASNSTVNIGVLQPVTVQFLSNGVGVAGATVTFSTTRGTVNPANPTDTTPSTATAVTGADGKATVNIASTTAGSATVLAQLVGGGQATLPVNFVAVNPAKLVLQANPGAIPPNTGGSTTHQSTLEATVRDANGNPVAKQQVNFNIVEDVSGGTLSAASVLTDSDGKAKVQYIAGANSTANDGVRITATAATNSLANDQVRLTVNGQALFINIGMGNEMSNLDSTTYSKPLSIYVTDATGNPVGNQQVTVSVFPTGYYIGWLIPVLDKDGNFKEWTIDSATVSDICLNNDVNKNGIVDGLEVAPLRPGNVVAATPGLLTTDGTGRATFSLQYGEQYAWWVDIEVVARASVAGTETRTTLPISLLPMLIDDIKSQATPANKQSPFNSKPIDDKTVGKQSCPI